MIEKFVKLKEAAEMLGLSAHVFRRILASGHGPDFYALNPNSKFKGARFRESELREWAEKNRRAGSEWYAELSQVSTIERSLCAERVRQALSQAVLAHSRGKVHFLKNGSTRQ